jgi:hypothetical protein
MLQPVDNVDVSRVFAELGLLDETHPILKLFSRPLLTYPSHLMLSGFLIAYCTILGIFFWRLKKRPLQSWVFWSALGLIITVMTAWAYHGLAERGLRQAALRFDLTTLEVLPDTGYMHLRGALGVFSAPGGQFTMPLQYPESILRHTFARGAGRAGQTLDVILAEPAVAIHNIVLAPWALRLFTIEGMAPAVLQVSAQRHRAGLTVQVENHSALALQGATVAYKGMLFPLGTVAPQAAILNEIYPGLHSSEDSAQRAWQALFKQRPMVADTRLAYLQEVLLQHYFGDQRLAEVSATPLLVGWLPGPTTLQQAAAASPIWGMTLVISRLSEP